MPPFDEKNNNTNMTFNACTVKAVVSNGSNVYRGYFTAGANGSTKRTFTLGTDSNICTLIAGSKLGSGDAVTTSSEPSFTDLTGNRYNNGGTATKDSNYQIIAE